MNSNIHSLADLSVCLRAVRLSSSDLTMRVKILGSAAGGGFPAIGTVAARTVGVFAKASSSGRARTQTQIAIDANPDYAHPATYWGLVNASPDLRAQTFGHSRAAPVFERKYLDPHSRHLLAKCGRRFADGTFAPARISGISHSFDARSSPHSGGRKGDSVFRGARQSRAPPVEWVKLPLGLSPLATAVKIHNPAGPPQLIARAIPLGGEYPDYVSGRLRAALPPDEAVMGLVFDYSGKRLFVAPGTPNRNTGWKDWAISSDVVLVDGTFWSDAELIHTGRSKKTAREIGHLPLSGPGGLLDQFPKSSRARKIYWHSPGQHQSHP